ncbi:hypothetical protein DRQ36_11340 [bacterium]|nr:MAG: hypothetical protein DRQ36_11340 [bacterium]
MINESIPKKRVRDVFFCFFALGSLWGFSEIVLGEAIRASGLPFRAGILTGIGFGLMAIAAALFRKRAMLLIIPVVVVAVRQLAVPVLQVPFVCKANSCLAVGLEGFALTGAIALAWRKIEKRFAVRVAVPVSAAIISAGAFWAIGMKVAPCPYLLSFNRPGGLISFIAAEGIPWAVFSGILFPVGYWVGRRLRERVPAFAIKKPAFYFAISVLVIMISWTASGIAIANGL